VPCLPGRRTTRLRPRRSTAWPGRAQVSSRLRLRARVNRRMAGIGEPECAPDRRAVAARAAITADL